MQTLPAWSGIGGRWRGRWWRTTCLFPRRPSVSCSCFTPLHWWPRAFSSPRSVLARHTVRRSPTLLLGLLLPLVSGDQQVEVDTAKIVETLLEDQLLPLCAGLFLRHRLPALADRLVRPARALSLILNVALLGTILTIQFGLLVAIPPRAFGGMFLLVLAAFAAGWLLGGPGRADRTAMVMAASVRNVSVSLVIAMASFPGTPAIVATTAFGLFQTIVMALIALGWGRLARPCLEHDPEK